MNGKHLLGAASVAALVLGASSVQAAIVEVTYAGTVTQGYDQSGLFGLPGADLTGESYKVTYRFNTAVGNTTGPKYFAMGGTGFGYPTPSLGTTVMINGRSVSSNLNGYLDEISGFNGYTGAAQSHETKY